MPYTHRKVGDKTCVYKKEDGSKVGCTKGSVKKYLAALHANVHEETDKIKGGLADGKTVKDIADKHDTSVVSIKKELRKGVNVEKEHTSDNNLAYEIAKDHTWEDDKYYEDPMFAKEVEECYKRKIKEDVDLSVTDESPTSISVLVKYNDRNAGIIVVAPANAKNTLEIVSVRFKKGYETLFIINQSIQSLWGLFEGYNHIIVAPELEAVEFWNKMGFSRISKHYLISNRGH